MFYGVKGLQPALGPTLLLWGYNHNCYAPVIYQQAPGRYQIALMYWNLFEVRQCFEPFYDPD